MADANIHPSVLAVRDRLHDMFPEVIIPLDIIGWHIRQSNSIEVVCSNVAAEILKFGKVVAPKAKVTNTENSAASTTSSATTMTNYDEILLSLYEVFCHIPHDHIDEVYKRIKSIDNPDWYDDVVNELLAHHFTANSTKKRSFDDENLFDTFIPEDYYRLLAIFPDIDPDYAYTSYFKFLESDKIDLNVLITSLIENGYPKLTDKLEQTRNQQLKENLRNPKFEIEEFLKTFPEPFIYFNDKTKVLSESYKKHAYIYLANAFARISTDYIKEILNNNNYRFAPSMKQLQQEFHSYHTNKTKSNAVISKLVNQRAREPIPIPDIPDEIFYKDLCYTKHEDEISGK